MWAKLGVTKISNPRLRLWFHFSSSYVWPIISMLKRPSLHGLYSLLLERVFRGVFGTYINTGLVGFSRKVFTVLTRPNTLPRCSLEDSDISMSTLNQAQVRAFSFIYDAC
jgi:hypothetical protein